ncbi:MAG: hypothetical protein OZ921_12545 [Sorangiineae bacterium]|nr:hypothetical protein [Polyangiaceae bacterium]MEB2323335.1 hypothetical protein [Sorangiineae bacterium]
MDVVAMLTLAGSFALLVTVHVALAYGLSWRKPWWRGPVALVVPPLAPWWGLEEGMRVRAALWLLAVCVYAVARILGALGAS